MNCRNQVPDRRRQRGVALVVAMLVFALATTLVVAMSSEFTLFLQRGSNSFLSGQANAYLRGGEDLARMVLIQDAEDDEAAGEGARDDLSELWAQQVPPYTLDEGGYLTGSLQDLENRININELAAGPANDNDRFTAVQAQFLRLLQSFDEPRVSEQDARLILEAVRDWLDQDQEPRDFGAEDDYYYDVEPSYRAANRNMVSVSELRMVAYVTPEIYLAVEPYLTVWGSGNINIHTAPLQILRTINSTNDLNPLTIGEGEALLALRKDEDQDVGFESMQAFLASPVLEGLELDPGLTDRLVQTSEYFLYSGQVEVADRSATLYSVLRRTGVNVETLARVSGSL
jgi:general secretion pathway protein K